MPFWAILTGPLLENSQCQVLPESKGSFPRTVDEECMEGLFEDERTDFLQAKEQQESCIKRFLGFEETLLTPKLKKNLDYDVAVDSGHRSCSLGDVWQRTRVVEFRIGRKRRSFFTLRRKMLFCACAKDSLITATGRSSLIGCSPCSNVLCYRFAKEH